MACILIYAFYFILKQNKTDSPVPLFSIPLVCLSSPDLILTLTQVGNSFNLTKLHASRHSFTDCRPTDRNSREKWNQESRRNPSKTGRGRIRFHRIASIRERVNLHSIKFVVIKSISTIQPAWPLYWHTPRASS